MSLDAAATVAALDAARAVFRRHIESNQGRIIDMAGDSVLAVFASASGAVAAALNIQADVNDLSQPLTPDRRMRFRIGVHLGDVIEKVDGSVYGDGVNIAARLEALTEPGGISISDAVRGAVKGRVAALYQDQGVRSVKHIADPVHVWSVHPEGSTPLTSNLLTAPGPSTAAEELDLPLPDKPSIAVLPFASMSSDPEQEHFIDGVIEDIITALSRFRSLFVIARNSTFTYKGKAVDIRAVGKELGVRYVLEGSIRRAASRVRVTAQLIDALTGNHIWAEKYDRGVEDIFAVQEELTQAIVAAIAPMIDAAEIDKVRRRRPDNLSAYEVAMHARAYVTEAHMNTDHALRAKGIDMARKALAIDPRSAIALNALALGHLGDLFDGTAPDPQHTWQQGMDAATKLIEVDPSSSEGYARKAALLFDVIGADRADEARIILARARELNPNDVDVLRLQGVTEQRSGDYQASLEPLLLAIRIAPRNPQQFRNHAHLALACLGLRDYATAMGHIRLALSDAPKHGRLHMLSATILVGLDDVKAARAAFEQARQLAPGLLAQWMEDGAPTRDAAARHRLRMFLRIAAGLEDRRAADAIR